MIMKVNELNALIENIVTSEVKKIISEQSEGKKEVYHVTCEGEPIVNCETKEEAQEHVNKLKKEHPGKQFIIEKADYESHGDMIEKLDKMGEELEETENNNMKEESKDAAKKLDTKDNSKPTKGASTGSSGNSDVRSPTSTDAYTAGNVTVTGGAGAGADTTVNIKSDPEKQRRLKSGQGEKQDTKEALIGGQKKLDKNHNNELDSQDFKMLRGQKRDVEEDQMCDECGDGYMEEEWQNEEACPKCGKELCECGMGMYESLERKKNKKIRLKESELIILIKSMVKESINGEPGAAGVPGIVFTNKAQQGSKKENNQAMSDVSKKMKDYLNFDGNDNSEFPHQNGVATKKATFNNTKEQDEEVAKNFAGLQNLDYDIEPGQQFKDRLKKAIEGHTTMGNAPTTEKASIKPSNGSEKGKEAKEKEGNHIQTPETAKMINKQTKDRQKDKDERVLYPKERVPVNESTVKFKNILAEEISKMKNLSNYNKKTQ